MYAIHITIGGEDRWLDPDVVPGPPTKAKLFEVATEALSWGYGILSARKAHGDEPVELKLTPCIVLTGQTPKGKWQGFVTTSRVRPNSTRIFPSREPRVASRSATPDLDQAARWDPDRIQDALMDDWARIEPVAHLYCVVFCNRGMNL